MSLLFRGREIEQFFTKSWHFFFETPGHTGNEYPTVIVTGIVLIF